MQKPIVRTLLITLSLLILATPIVLYAKSGAVTVAANEKVAGDVLRAGRVVRILAPVDGDVMVIGGTVEVAGPVTGDVIAIGGEVIISADVGGSIRAAGGTVEISGSVGRSVLAAGGRVVVKETAEIGWSVTAATSDLVFSGRAGRDVRAWADQALIAGEVEGDLALSTSVKDGVELGRTAIVQGDFDYTATGPAIMREGAVVRGKTVPHQLPERDRRAAAIGVILGRLVRMFGLVAVGLVFLSLVPKAVDGITNKEYFWTWKTLGEGFLWLVLTPLAAVVLLVTIIGAPLAFILLASWAVLVYCAQIIASIFLGRVFFRHVFKSEEKAPKFMDLLFGALVWVILTSLPYAGWVIGLAGVLLGMGSLVAFKRQELAKYR